MNYSVVRYILGWIMVIEAAFMLMPCMVAAIYGEQQGLAFLLVLLGSAFVGALIVLRKPDNTNFYLKEGFVTVALSWILLSLIGCLPFYFNGDIPHFTDALFETVSGFTTTGATILGNVEGLSRCSLFWRSFTHWIGGMGVLVFLLAVLPLAGGSRMNLMKAESPGPSVGKLVPKVRYTAMILYVIYIVLTMLEIIMLLCGRMSLFESVTTAFGTAGTGGFGIRNDSMMSASPYIQWVVSIFMIIFGVNFNVYFLIIMGKLRQAFKYEELRVYVAVILTSTVIVCINICDMIGNVADALRHSVFQVASIITTTGFSSADFNLWPETSKIILVLLMFIGACAGSTGGGIKVSRFMILVKTFFKEIISYLHPRSIKKIKVEGKVVEHEVLRATNVYFITYMLLFALSIFLLSFENLDFTTNFTATASMMNNVGPGLNLVGPMENFGFLSDFSKFVLMFDMLAGRLELFPLLLLFCPAIWKGKRIMNSDSGDISRRVNKHVGKKGRRKRIILICSLVCALILLVPRRILLKDGGSVCYEALLYKVVNHHAMWMDDEDGNPQVLEGISVEILGFDVYSDVHVAKRQTAGADDGFIDDGTAHSVNDWEVTVFQLEPSARGVDELMEELGWLSAEEDPGTYFNVTPEEISERYGFDIFKNDYFGNSILVYGDVRYPIADSFGSYGINSFAVADLNGDGSIELYYTYSWGSGLIRTNIACFDFAAMRETVFTDGDSERSYMNFSDVVLTAEEGRIGVYEGAVEQQKVLNDAQEFQYYSAVEMEMTSGDKLGEIYYDGSDIRLEVE